MSLRDPLYIHCREIRFGASAQLCTVFEQRVLSLSQIWVAQWFSTLVWSVSPLYERVSVLSYCSIWFFCLVASECSLWSLQKSWIRTCHTDSSILSVSLSNTLPDDQLSKSVLSSTINTLSLVRIWYSELQQVLLYLPNSPAEWICFYWSQSNLC